MSTEDTPSIEVPYHAEEKETTGRRRGPSRTIPEVTEGVVNFLISALEQNNKDIDIPAHSDHEDAVELSDEVLSHFGLAGGTTLSLEGLFSSDNVVGDGEGITVDRPYVGTVSGLDYDEGEVDRHAKILAGKAINGYYKELVDNSFGEEKHVSLGVGAKNRHESPEERASFVRVKVTDGKASERTKWRAQMDVGIIDQTEYEELCAEADYDPYPRAGDEDEE